MRPTDQPVRPRRTRLLFRIYAAAFLTVLAVAVTFAWLRARPLLPSAFDPRARSLLTALANPATRAEATREIRALGVFDASVFDAEGRLLATTMAPGLDALPEQEAAVLDGRPRPLGAGRMALAVPIPAGGAGYGVIRLAPPPVGPKEFVVDLAVVVICIVAAGGLLARSIVRPLERIAAAARALGQGDWGVRLRLQRRDEIGQVAGAFDDMSERLQRLMSAQRELLASVSHELRTPLARIRVAIDLAEEGDADVARASLRDVADDLAELESLVDEILATTRFDVAVASGHRAAPALRHALHTEVLDVRILVSSAVDRVGARLPARAIHVAQAAAPLLVEADATLLRRALENVIDNALKYSAPQSSVEVTVSHEGRTACIEVRDRGVGIATDDLPNVFEPFFRADRSRARASGGIGLGLTLTKRIVEAHGGTVAIESRLGEGTTVRVAMPLAEARHGSVAGD